MGVVNTKNYMSEEELRYKTVDQNTYIENIPVGCWAVRNMSVLKKLKEQNYNFNVVDEECKTPLHYSIDYPESFLFLINTNIKFDTMDLHGNTALHYAVLANNELFIKPLMCCISKKNYAGDSPFHLAVKHRKYNVVCCVLNSLKDSLFLQKSFMINNFQDGNKKTPLYHAIYNYDMKMLAFFHDFVDKEKVKLHLAEYGKKNYSQAVDIMTLLT